MKIKTKSVTCYSFNKINRDCDDESCHLHVTKSALIVIDTKYSSIMSSQMHDITSDDVTKTFAQIPVKIILVALGVLLLQCFLQTPYRSLQKWPKSVVSESVRLALIICKR